MFDIQWSLTIRTDAIVWFPVITHSGGFAWTSNHGLLTGSQGNLDPSHDVTFRPALY